MRRTYFLFVFLCFSVTYLPSVKAQPLDITLNSHWFAKRQADVQVDGTVITSPGYQHT